MHNDRCVAAADAVAPSVYDFRRSIVVTVNGFLPAPPERAKGRKQPAPTKLAPTKIVLEDIYLAVVSMDDLLAKSLNAL